MYDFFENKECKVILRTFITDFNWHACYMLTDTLLIDCPQSHLETICKYFHTSHCTQYRWIHIYVLTTNRLIECQYMSYYTLDPWSIILLHIPCSGYPSLDSDIIHDSTVLQPSFHCHSDFVFNFIDFWSTNQFCTDFWNPILRWTNNLTVILNKLLHKFSVIFS